MIKRRENSFSLQNLKKTLFWAPCGIGMNINGILKFCFWITLHQGTLSFLCSRIQGYMLSLMNKVDPCIAPAMDIVWDAKPIFLTSATCLLAEILSSSLLDEFTQDGAITGAFLRSSLNLDCQDMIYKNKLRFN